MIAITKERLEPVIERLEHYATNVKWTNVQAAQDMLTAVNAMRIALASLEAEPVAYIIQDADARSRGEKGILRYFANISDEDINEYQITVTPLYTAPLAPVSVPDAATAIRACMEEFPESVHDIVEECAAIAENACRAAMLQGAEPVTTGYKLPFEQWLSQQGERIEIDCGCVSVEVFMHWLRMAYGDGNSPVIQDGWVACSERMPGEVQEVIVMDTKRGKVQSGMIYQGGRFIDFNEEYFEVKNPPYWMPLPAAPQQEA